MRRLPQFAIMAALMFASGAAAADQAPRPPATYETTIVNAWKNAHNKILTTAVAKGEKFDFAAREKADTGKPKTRANMVAEMEAAIAASFPMVEAKQSPSLIGWLEYQGEHYGKLVTAYRVNGIVPPISRPK